ncbi:hypothetical protein [Pseudomonas sp. Au-Pse12]|uniref:hypothetical protein n=1 Tax=Pseudomonas sp. Au-Pse12 TaxID=2906459 RepID=UPI001E47FAAB|nr:hypothetical protein [Pseudomonas sp. Au-Pse12]MCE4058475.1 hypothetical protein [Pseudomonas sp. Au-Pse12]
MNRPPQALAPVPEPLTITLQGHDLEPLRAYREAVHALKVENWPAEAKEGRGPLRYKEHYKRQKEAAADALAHCLSRQIDRLPA